MLSGIRGSCSSFCRLIHELNIALAASEGHIPLYTDLFLLLSCLYYVNVHMNAKMNVHVKVIMNVHENVHENVYVDVHKNVHVNV